MRNFQVRLTEAAETDLVDLIDYIAKKDSVDSAYYVLDKLEAAIFSLDHQPERGHYPPELDRLGIKDFREIYFKPYRIIYEVIGSKVIILGVFDGRRDMQSLLERRMLR